MKAALIIGTYNRPEYLKKCLISIQNTYLEKGTLIYIIDDGSTNQKTINLIKKFNKPGCIIKKIYKLNNKGIYDSYIKAYEYCFKKTDYVININSDIIVNNYFYDMMLYYHQLFPNDIISGFNTLTKSKTGIIRHPIIYDGKFFAVKKHAGSACFGLTKKIYYKFFETNIIDLNKKKLKCYDTISTKNASSVGTYVVCTVPSVVEHIGFNSTLNHFDNPDVSIDYKQFIDLSKMKKKLITVNIATYPPRYESLKRVINNLLKIDKIDKIRVYLNEYKEVPIFLKHEKIQYIINQKNLKDNGKFYWAQSYNNEYYFSLDDDLLINEEYINEHIKLLNQYNNKIFVSLHGKILNKKPKDFRDILINYHFLKNVDDNHFINLPGSGVLLFDNNKFKLPLNLFKSYGMADLWIAKYCQENNIPCIIRKHKKNDIILSYNGKETLWNAQYKMKNAQNKILNSINNWKIIKL